MVRAYLASVKVGTARYITFHKIGKLLSALTFAFGDFTLLAGRQEGHPACKKHSGGVLAWLSVWSKLQTCIWPS